MICATDETVAFHTDELSGVPNLILVENLPLERILFDRNLVGLPFRRACLDASRLFVRHVRDELPGLDPAELVILSKGLLYQLAEAVGRELDTNLPVNLLATSRVGVVAEDAEIEVSYRCLDAGGSTLLIGDTVASGATVVAALGEYARSHELRRVYLFSYAGSLIGARRIAGYCELHDIELTMLFGLAAFGLGANGFDLSFLHPSTVAAEKYKARAAEQFGNKPVSAVGWDFGSQAMAPEKYRRLCWLEAETFGLHDSRSLALAARPSSVDSLAKESSAVPAHVWHSVE